MLGKPEPPKGIIFDSEISTEGLMIKTPDGVTLGKVPIDTLARCGLFNIITTDDKGDVLTNKNYNIVKWEKLIDSTGGTWIQSGKYLGDVGLKVYDAAKTNYIITNNKTNDTLYFSADYPEEKLFDLGRRKIHVIEEVINGKKEFFILRIIGANLVNKERNWVRILQIRLEPTCE